MTPLAALLLARGARVTGSDGPVYPPMSDRLAALGIEVRPAWSAQNVGADATDVVAGNLARSDNPEILEAQRRGLPVRSMPETLQGEILAGRHPVVVAGTHGKTTTTALTAWLLAAAGRDPGFLIGGEPRELPGARGARAGRGVRRRGRRVLDVLRRQGAEVPPLPPQTFVLTSVEFDHADIYADLDAVKAAFRQGSRASSPPTATSSRARDDANVREVLSAARATVTTYSRARTPAADLSARDIREDEAGIFFDVCADRGADLLRVRCLSPGGTTSRNALAAVAVALSFSSFIRRNLPRSFLVPRRRAPYAGPRHGGRRHRRRRLRASPDGRRDDARGREAPLPGPATLGRVRAAIDDRGARGLLRALRRGARRSGRRRPRRAVPRRAARWARRARGAGCRGARRAPPRAVARPRSRRRRPTRSSRRSSPSCARGTSSSRCLPAPSAASRESSSRR